MKNMHAPIRRVRHADLSRANGETGYKSLCPVCHFGFLLISRHPESHTLLRYDRCVSCGQRFAYTDEKINGEPLTPDVVRDT